MKNSSQSTPSVTPSQLDSSEFVGESRTALPMGAPISGLTLGPEAVLINLGLKLHDVGSHEAYSTLHKAIAANPESSYPLLGLGITLLSDGQLVEANYHLRQLLKMETGVLASTRVLTYKTLATLGRMASDYVAAGLWLRQAIELNPDDDEALCNLSEVLAQSDQYEEALKMFGKVPDSSTYATEAAQGRATALVKLHRYKDALKIWTRLLTTDHGLQFPQDRCSALLSCARVLVLLERVPEAEMKYEEALKLSLEPYEVYLDLASLSRSRREQSKALLLFEMVAKNDPNLVNSSHAWRAIGDLSFEQGHTTKAVESWLEAGSILLSLRKFEAAKEAFTLILKADAQNELALAGRAEVLRIQENYEAAEQDYAQLLKIAPSDPWCIASRAQIYLTQEKSEDAVREFNHALVLSDEFDWIWAGRGEAYMQLREFEKAIQDFTIALDKDPDYFAALVYRGSCYRMAQDYLAAIADLRRAMELNPNHLECRVRLANVYRWMECYQAAEDEIERVLDYHPRCPSALAAKVSLLNFCGEHAEAVALFEEHLEVLSARHATNILYGESLVFQQREQDAHKIFQKVLKKVKGIAWDLSADRAWTLYFDSLALRRMGEDEEAKEQLLKAIETEEKSIEKFDRDRARINLALFLLVSGKENKAKFQYQAILKGVQSRYVLLEAKRDLRDYNLLFPDNRDILSQIRYVEEKLEQYPEDNALDFTWRPYRAAVNSTLLA